MASSRLLAIFLSSFFVALRVALTVPQNAAAPGCNFLIRPPFRTRSEFILPASGEKRVGVCIDKTGQRHRGRSIDRVSIGKERVREVCSVPDPCDNAVFNEDRCVFKNRKLAHLTPSLERLFLAAHGDELFDVAEQELHCGFYLVVARF